MKNQFIPYELAVKLRELGFDEECLNIFFKREKRMSFDIGYYPNKNSDFTEDSNYISAPLWQQAFDWFREKQNIVGSVDGGCEQNFFFFSITKLGEESFFSTDFKSYEEARQACLEKIIELCQK